MTSHLQGQTTPNSHQPEPEVRRSGARWLLVLPFLAVLWVPFYNDQSPTLVGIPFFYWYQLAWVLICAVIIGVVYVIERR